MVPILSLPRSTQALQKKELTSREAVLNGIAWDPEEDVLYLTGACVVFGVLVGVVSCDRLAATKVDVCIQVVLFPTHPPSTNHL